MAKPILNNILAFDVNKGTELNFKYDQSIYGYNIKFYNTSSNEVVKTIIGIWNTTTIILTPNVLSGLTNETNYCVSLSIYNTVDDYKSAFSKLSIISFLVCSLIWSALSLNDSTPKVALFL